MAKVCYHYGKCKVCYFQQMHFSPFVTNRIRKRTVPILWERYFFAFLWNRKMFARWCNRKDLSDVKYKRRETGKLERFGIDYEF